MKLYFFLNNYYINQKKYNYYITIILNLSKDYINNNKKKYNNKIKYNYIYINNNNRYFIK